MKKFIRKHRKTDEFQFDLNSCKTTQPSFELGVAYVDGIFSMRTHSPLSDFEPLFVKVLVFLPLLVLPYL